MEIANGKFLVPLAGIEPALLAELSKSGLLYSQVYSYSCCSPATSYVTL